MTTFVYVFKIKQRKYNRCHSFYMFSYETAVLSKTIVNSTLCTKTIVNIHAIDSREISTDSTVFAAKWPSKFEYRSWRFGTLSISHKWYFQLVSRKDQGGGILSLLLSRFNGPLGMVVVNPGHHGELRSDEWKNICGQACCRQCLKSSQ